MIMKKIFFFACLAGLFLLSLKVQAQEAVTTNQASPIEEVSVIKAEDLDISQPTILPGSRFYFLKQLWRGVNLLVAREPAKKVELRLKYANEKLIEAQELSQKAKIKTEIIEKQLKNYQSDLDKAKEQLEKIETTKQNVKEKLEEKYLDYSLKQQLILQKLATQVPVEVYEKIEENRQQHLERLGEVMAKVAEKQDAVGKIQEAIQSVVETRPMIHTQTIEILEDLKEKVPEDLKPKIVEIKIDAIKNAAQAIKAIPAEVRQEILEKQLKNIVNPIKAVEIIEEVAKIEPTLKPIISEVKTKPVEYFLEERLKKLSEEEKEIIIEKMIVPSIKVAPAPPVFDTEQVKSLFIPPPEKKIEILKDVQQKLEIKLPEQAKASEVLKRVIERQTIKLQKLQTDKPIEPTKPVEIIEPENVNQETNGTIREEVKNFCGKSSYGPCQTDTDCVTSGCSGQVCQSRNEEPIVTTCEWRDCYDAKKFNLRCGCFEGKCQWHR